MKNESDGQMFQLWRQRQGEVQYHPAKMGAKLQMQKTVHSKPARRAKKELKINEDRQRVDKAQVA